MKVFLGSSLDLSDDGQRLIVGVYGYDNQRGAARVYQIKETGSEFLGELLIGEEIDILFGWSVSISGDGDRIVVGTPLGDSGIETYDGLLQAYEYDGDNIWFPLGAPIYGDNSMSGLGSSVSMSSDGGIIAVSADGATNQNGQSSGKVYTYRWSGGEWEQFGNIWEGSSNTEVFGHIIDLSADGTTVAIGAPRYDIVGGTNNNTGRAAIGPINPVVPFNVVCQNIVVNLDSTGIVTIPALSVDDGSSSPNGILNYNVFPNRFTCGVDIRDHNVILTVTDNENNMDTCHAVVTITDTNYNCCYSFLEIDDNPIPDLTFRTSTLIRSSGLVRNNGHVIFKSGMEIRLETDFQVDSSGILECYREGCVP